MNEIRKEFESNIPALEQCTYSEKLDCYISDKQGVGEHYTYRWHEYKRGYTAAKSTLQERLDEALGALGKVKENRYEPDKIGIIVDSELAKTRGDK